MSCIIEARFYTGSVDLHNYIMEIIVSLRTVSSVKCEHCLTNYMFRTDLRISCNVMFHATDANTLCSFRLIYVLLALAADALKCRRARMHLLLD